MPPSARCIASCCCCSSSSVTHTVCWCRWEPVSMSDWQTLVGGLFPSAFVCATCSPTGAVSAQADNRIAGNRNAMLVMILIIDEIPLIREKGRLQAVVYDQIIAYPEST